MERAEFVIKSGRMRLNRDIHGTSFPGGMTVAT